MANTSDACVPQALTDFVFDLYDSVTLSQLTEEQSRLYNTEFRDLSSKVRKRREGFGSGVKYPLKEKTSNSRI